MGIQNPSGNALELRVARAGPVADGRTLQRATSISAALNRPIGRAQRCERSVKHGGTICSGSGLFYKTRAEAHQLIKLHEFV